MKSVLALRHGSSESLGQLGIFLKKNGFDTHYFEVGIDSFSDISPLNADIVVVLDGPISAYDVEEYPYLRTEIAWLRARLIEDLPTLGICLGAQLIAAALHARVYPGTCGKEIGWNRLKPALDTEESPCLRKLIEQGTHVLHWHGDTFDLPKGAKHLASTDQYQNQAFSWGDNCLALQFHPELDIHMLEQWLIGRAYEIAHTRNISLSELRMDTKQYGSRFQLAIQDFWQEWLNSLQLTTA
ncbi:glutamine amidotransferase [Ampullimonas aquatilis]|uniref:glutamine amidotransferase n=1 Tax=Ampullimonas aquatilis TaxID=1341549 RepID=UPI003C740BA3